LGDPELQSWVDEIEFQTWKHSGVGMEVQPLAVLETSFEDSNEL
jgi:hypothetical protein